MELTLAYIKFWTVSNVDKRNVCFHTYHVNLLHLMAYRTFPFTCDILLLYGVMLGAKLASLQDKLWIVGSKDATLVIWKFRYFQWPTMIESIPNITNNSNYLFYKRLILAVVFFLNMLNRKIALWHVSPIIRCHQNKTFSTSYIFPFPLHSHPDFLTHNYSRHVNTQV